MVAQAAVMNSVHQEWEVQASGEGLHQQDIHKAAILHTITRGIQLQEQVEHLDILVATGVLMVDLDLLLSLSSFKES
jgi:hypothetical protein